MGAVRVRCITWPPSASDRVCVSLEFLYMVREKAREVSGTRPRRNTTRGSNGFSTAPVRYVLLLGRQRNHDVVQRAQTLVDTQRLCPPHALRPALGDILRARKVDNVPADAASSIDATRCTAAAAHFAAFCGARELVSAAHAYGDDEVRAAGVRVHVGRAWVEDKAEEGVDTHGLNGWKQAGRTYTPGATASFNKRQTVCCSREIERGEISHAHAAVAVVLKIKLLGRGNVRHQQVAQRLVVHAERVSKGGEADGRGAHDESCSAAESRLQLLTVPAWTATPRHQRAAPSLSSIA
jgi:hypothetical protein